MQQYLASTPLLDYQSPELQQLITERAWQGLDDYHKIGAAYDFVRDEIPLGYNATDNRRASLVFKDGYGQCNTKTILVMALLRGLGIACRLHGATVKNQMQAGAIPALLLSIAPDSIIHSWVEVWHDGRWINLEGLIVDKPYLSAIQQRHKSRAKKSFSGYAIATQDLAQPNIDWRGQDTYIQIESLLQDLGSFDSPELFYAQHGTNLRGLRRWLYRYILRHAINSNVARIRQQSPQKNQCCME